jgi:hypothetical protein
VKSLVRMRKKVDIARKAKSEMRIRGVAMELDVPFVVRMHGELSKEKIGECVLEDFNQFGLLDSLTHV